MEGARIEAPQGVTAPQGSSIATTQTMRLNDMNSLSENKTAVEVSEEIMALALQGEAIAICLANGAASDLSHNILENVLWDLQQKFERISKLC